MRLEYFKAKNFGPFGDFEVDLTRFPVGSLVAVTGRNGAGKSTFLETAIAGAAYRTMPTQGTLVKRARARDSFVESRLVNGHSYTVRHLLDAVSGKSEAVALLDGVPCFDSSKVRDFDTWASKHLPTPDVLFASVFAAQGSQGFIGLSSGERIAVILRVLGVQRYEVMAEKARENERAAKGNLATITARIADEEKRALDVTAVEALLEVERIAVERLKERIETSQAELVESRAELVRCREIAKELEASLRQRHELDQELTRSERERADLETRILNNRNVLAEGEAIRAAIARVALLEADIANGNSCAAEYASKGEAAAARCAASSKALGAARARASAAEIRVKSLEQRLIRLGELEAAAGMVPEATAQIAVLEQAWKGAEDALEQVRGSQVAGKDERIVELRTGLTQIRDGSAGAGVEELRSLADTALDRDDVTVKDAAEQPERLKLAQATARAAFETHRAVQAELERLRRAESEAKSLRQAATDLDAARKEASSAAEEAEKHAAEEAEAGAIATSTWAELGSMRKRINESAAELDQLKPLAAKADPLARAEARLAELEPQLEAAEAEARRIRSKLDAIPLTGGATQEPDIGKAETALEGLGMALRSAGNNVVVLEQKAAQARESHERLGVLQAERSGIEAELADWARLAQDLGRDGLQAGEVDGAGPELTELCNDLLHEAFGPRFTLTIETARLSADGKKMVDECSVRVVDTVAGRDGEAREFSGGEKVILSEAVSLALAMLACRRAGIERPSIVRDESGAALDSERAPQYVAMLRRAAQIVGAVHVLLVSHSPAVVELCDDRIEIPS